MHTLIYQTIAAVLIAVFMLTGCASNTVPETDSDSDADATTHSAEHDSDADTTAHSAEDSEEHDGDALGRAVTRHVIDTTATINYPIVIP